MDLDYLNPVGTSQLPSFGGIADPLNGAAQLPTLQSTANPTAANGWSAGLGNALGALGSWLGKSNEAVGNLGNKSAANQTKLGFAFDAASGLANMWSDWQNNKRLDQALKFSMDMQNKNYDMLRKETNRELSDRQDRRVSANPNAMSRDDYLAKWGV